MDFSFLQDFQNTGAIKLKAHIANAIRNGIIEGKLKPGQHLQQDKIASAMGVSSIPVREALSVLKEERHVEYFPNRGTFVSEIDAEKVREAYEIRFFLESGALSISLPKMKNEAFHEAEQLMQLEADETNAHRKTKFDLDFHKSLCRPCGRPHLMKLIGQIHGHMERFVHLSFYLMNFQRHPEFNHKALLSLCKERKVDLATQLLKHHLDVASDLICERFES